MAGTSDLIMDLGVKGAQKLLSVPLGKAAKYYDAHLKLFKEAVEAGKKGKDITSQVPKLQKQLNDYKREVATMTMNIPRNIQMPKKDAKVWGKSKKVKTYKEAMELYMTGLGACINTLEESIKNTENAKTSVDKLEKNLLAVLQSKSKGGNLDIIATGVSSRKAFLDLGEVGKDIKASYATILADQNKRLKDYRKALSVAVKVKT